MQMYMWEYNKEGAQPMVVLKTRRSLRAVHFQPHGTPLLLTAEVCIMPEVAQHTLHCSTCPVVFLRKRMTDSTMR